ncbi:unnamed protein product [Ostreobium quekettii]|uniref:Ion transport domain-containing protein n=1 Tax=Ostreobium quekettii TaxID=121088 RepID=A0A8S1IMV6_9CHLO|nr:unnamed protein product [Ostreobium quekettii]
MAVDGNAKTRSVRGWHLDAGRLLAVSPDGRRIACAADRDLFVVWQPEAAEGCIPDYYSLKMSHAIEDRACMDKILQAFGPALFNYPNLMGMSLFLHAILDDNVDCVSMMIRWALKEDVKVSMFTYPVQGTERTNGLQMAINRRSPAIVRLLVNALLGGLTTEQVMVDVFQKSLLNLGEVYPSLLMEVIGDDRMLQSIGEMQCPEHIFHKDRFFTGTSDKYWPPDFGLAKLWEELSPQTRADRNTVMLPAVAKVIPYPHIAQIGGNGILRPLLVNDVPPRTFSSKTLQCVISYKWENHARQLLYDEIWHYAMLLALFTGYTIILGFEREEWSSIRDVADGSLGVSAIAFLVGTCLLAVANLVRECKQIKVSRSDGKIRGFNGFMVWLRSKWNMWEWSSYISIIVIIPIVHLTSFLEDLRVHESWLVAVTSIMLWWKMLYYSSAFRPTGPLVIMIFEIIKDISVFIFTAFAILFGFGIAFFVVFRHDVEENEDVSSQFGSVDRALFTTFGMMLGEFDIQLFYTTKLPFVSLALFVVYMMAMMIVLLNLLIAIMGDTYDRVKNVEEVAFLRSRASVIDDIESMLSESAKRKLE